MLKQCHYVMSPTATVRNLVYTPVKDRAARHTAATHSVPEGVHQKENVFT